MCQDQNAPPAPSTGNAIAGIFLTTNTSSSYSLSNFRIHFSNPSDSLNTIISYETDGLLEDVVRLPHTHAFEVEDLPLEMAIFQTCNPEASKKISPIYRLERAGMECCSKMKFEVGEVGNERSLCVVGRGVAVYTKGGQRMIGKGVIGRA